MRDLPTLLNTLEPGASLVERHLWLMDLLQWVRGDLQSIDGALARLRRIQHHRVTLNGTEIIRWHGPQADLTLYRDPRQGWPVEGDHSFGLATYAGGVAFRNVRVSWIK